MKRKLKNWVNALVVRHSDIQIVKDMAEYAKIPVIKAMTSGNHPCEILKDMYALSKVYGDLKHK